MMSYVNTACLQASVSTLKGVGPKIQLCLDKIGINAIEDLLFHLPLRYEDRTRIYTIEQLKPQAVVMIQGELSQVNIVGPRRILTCQLSDGTGKITLRFFHFNRSQLQRLRQPGVRLCCFGEVRQGYRGGLEMVHPEYRMLHLDEPLPLSTTLTPIYPITEGLQQRSIRKLMSQALSLLNQGGVLRELIPITVMEQGDFPQLKDAIHYIHSPPPDANTIELQARQHPAQQRLVLEELLAHHLSLVQLRKKTQTLSSWPLKPTGKLTQALLDSLSFSLTSAQLRAVKVIFDDMKQDYPMMRLLQGDVGSGKTVVAVLALLQAIESGFQAAIMAPTEILAEQHYRQLQRWLTPLGVTVGFIKGGMPVAVKRDSLKKIASGSFQLVVGTHALFQKDVQFSSLAVLVIDEQHRFGVRQRLALREKGIFCQQYPHQLVMTATPIPRSMSMMAYGDLQSVVLDELPPGRKPIKTVMIDQVRREEVIQRVASHCAKGAQAYWICTLVEESETLTAQAAEVTFVALSASLKQLRCGLVHGRMKPAEKEQVMMAFSQGDIDLLIATTVVEVGVDVPQASLMVIENPERLGLAQLHQLRGRVGRGSVASFCVLLFESPLSKNGFSRLNLIRSTQDGFRIAQTDLEMRGPGEVLGTRQAGLMDFKVANLLRDEALLDRVELYGTKMLTQYPQLVPQIIDRWLRHKQDLARV